jgi:hypothetical protein
LLEEAQDQKLIELREDPRSGTFLVSLTKTPSTSKSKKRRKRKSAKSKTS